MTLKPVQKEIIEMLESMLAKAKNGSLQNIIAVYDCDKQVQWMQSVKGDALPSLVGGIEAVKHLCLARISETEYDD